MWGPSGGGCTVLPHARTSRTPLGYFVSLSRTPEWCTGSLLNASSSTSKAPSTQSWSIHSCRHLISSLPTLTPTRVGTPTTAAQPAVSPFVLVEAQHSGAAAFNHTFHCQALNRNTLPLQKSAAKSYGCSTCSMSLATIQHARLRSSWTTSRPSRY